MEVKQCTKCKQVKSVTKFSCFHGRKKNGRSDKCKICEKKWIKNEVIKRHGKKKWEFFCFNQFRDNVRSLIRESFKRGKNNYTKKLSLEQILGCDIYFFRKYIESKFTKGMTFDNYGEWHLDHIIPLATAETEEDIIRLNHYTNFQPLWAEDNFSKGGTINEPTQVVLRL